MKSEKYGLFEHLNNISLDKEELTEEQMSSYTPYLINRFVSMVDCYLPVVNEINMYDLPKDVHCQFMKSFLPKRKQYFKYIKETKEDSYERECIETYFECGPNDSKEMMKLMSKSEIDFIVNKFSSISDNHKAKRKR
jgi:hypothetical protein